VAVQRRGGQRRYPRSARVNELLHEVLAEVIERMSDTDERISLLTVTAVETEADLRRATVFFASLPAPAAQALEEHRPALQAAIGRQARMKRTPRLSFAPDPALARAERLEAILRRLGPLGEADA
jgi:ribosome-binding factor A